MSNILRKKSKSKSFFKKVEVVFERGHCNKFFLYIFDDQIRWECLKYEIKFYIHFSVSEAKKRNKEMNTLENKIKAFEENFNNNESNQNYLKCKRVLNYIYDKKYEGIKIRSKCNWYEDSKKSSKIFLTFEKN